MSRRSIAIIAGAALGAILAALLWIFAGVELRHREHGETEYDFFAKHAPGLQVVFENPAQCGECDLRPWQLIGVDDRSRFADFCAARFGLTDVTACYAIFEERQRIIKAGSAPPTR
ncbi:MAG: hypothetical protein V4754_19815 [Pseudomonadota bacterium]